jgi:hypothetical protein
MSTVFWLIFQLSFKIAPRTARRLSPYKPIGHNKLTHFRAHLIFLTGPGIYFLPVFNSCIKPFHCHLDLKMLTHDLYKSRFDNTANENEDCPPQLLHHWSSATTYASIALGTFEVTSHTTACKTQLKQDRTAQETRKLMTSKHVNSDSGRAIICRTPMKCLRDKEITRHTSWTKAQFISTSVVARNKIEHTRKDTLTA